MVVFEMKTYLGDGAYAEWQDGMICLTTSDGISTTNVIYLDRDVLKAFEIFIHNRSPYSAVFLCGMTGCKNLASHMCGFTSNEVCKTWLCDECKHEHPTT